MILAGESGRRSSMVAGGGVTEQQVQAAPTLPCGRRYANLSCGTPDSHERCCGGDFSV